MKTLKTIAVCALLSGATASFAHVTLEQPEATAGSTYKAVFKVGHACAASGATTGLVVRLPAGFADAHPVPKAGWTTRVVRAAPEGQAPAAAAAVVEVRWDARDAEAALPDAFYDEFTVRGRLPASAGPLWFKVLQRCDAGQADWAEVPASGTDTRGLKAPAARLDVRPAPAAAPHAH